MSVESIKSLFPEEKQIPAEFAVTPLEQKDYLINGEIKSWKADMQEVLSPICLKSGNDYNQVRIGSYPLCTEKEALEALDGAYESYNTGRGQWATYSVEKRIQCVKDFIIRMKEKKKEIVTMLMWEIGKTYADSEKEFDRTVIYMEDTVNALKDLDRVSSRFEIAGGVIAQIRRSPLGVVLCMGPFNYPLNETFTTLIPALIMGNSIIFKPAKYGVLLLRPLLEAFRDSFPKGVVNTVYGDGKITITPIMSSGKVDVLAFIGSSKTANIIEKNHPKPNRLATIYGLEAKNPGIILDDADLDLTVSECVQGTLSYNGQRCTALKILFVHRKIADAFLAKYTEAVSALKMGMPWEKGVSITPLPESNKAEYLQGLVDDSVQNGAKVINPGGGEWFRTFYKPAVVYPVNEKTRLFREEQFGPVVPVIPFDDILTPITYIANSNYGQQASIFSKSPDTIARLIDPLANQVCRVNINSQCQRGPDVFPFTGRKDSADGTLSVSDALKILSIRTVIAAKDNDLNKGILTDITRKRKSNFLSTDYIL